jgi:hypothetical protein
MRHTRDPRRHATDEIGMNHPRLNDIWRLGPKNPYKSQEYQWQRQKGTSAQRKYSNTISLQLIAKGALRGQRNNNMLVSFRKQNEVPKHCLCPASI